MGIFSERLATLNARVSGWLVKLRCQGRFGSRKKKAATEWNTRERIPFQVMEGKGEGVLDSKEGLGKVERTGMTAVVVDFLAVNQGQQGKKLEGAASSGCNC